ncbi:hypothetical protein GCM10027073_06400 [Streptomyces chlorus]|uniref:Core-binding (CB) domain-containing protein n=1 Tax=Streptomyces chlorus TaxID=887452 RepID=A0ABW1DR18_9ACTN
MHIVPRLGSRKLNSVTPIVVERFLDELEADGAGRGNRVDIFRALKAILRNAYDKGAMADDPVKGVQEPEFVREKVVIPTDRGARHPATHLFAGRAAWSRSPRLLPPGSGPIWAGRPMARVPAEAAAGPDARRPGPLRSPAHLGRGAFTLIT